MRERSSGHGAGADAVALARAYYLDDPMDSAAAVALNGGVAYGSGLCGAITGAALDAFRVEHGSVDCRVLIGYDLRAPGG